MQPSLFNLGMATTLEGKLNLNLLLCLEIDRVSHTGYVELINISLLIYLSIYRENEIDI